MPLSGPEWIKLFPGSNRLEDLTYPFRGNASRFINALRAAGALVTISETLRPIARVYLMHSCYGIARLEMDPAHVPALDGVDIQWLHADALGLHDIAASRAAAERMVLGYCIVYPPAATSHHTDGTAVDMTIAWLGTLTILDSAGRTHAIDSLPHNGTNPSLVQVAATYGVKKLLSDAPHWSLDGH